MLREWEKKHPGAHRVDLQRARHRRAVAPDGPHAVRFRRGARDRRGRARRRYRVRRRSRRSSARPTPRRRARPRSPARSRWPCTATIESRDRAGPRRLRRPTNAMTARFVAPAAAAFAAVAGAVVIGRCRTRLPRADRRARPARQLLAARCAKAATSSTSATPRPTSARTTSASCRAIARRSATSPTPGAPMPGRSARRYARCGFPIGDVLASPYLPDDGNRAADVRPRHGDAGGARRARAPTPATATRTCAGCCRRRSAPGTNVVVASHGNPFVAVAGPPYLAEGEAAVIAPRGGRRVSRRRAPAQGDLAGAGRSRRARDRDRAPARSAHRRPVLPEQDLPRLVVGDRRLRVDRLAPARRRAAPPGAPRSPPSSA